MVNASVQITEKPISLKEIAEQYCSPVPSELDNAEIDSHIRKLEAVVSDAFAIEAKTIEPLTNELDQLRQARSLRHIAFPRIDMSFISTTMKRTKTADLGPAFAVFSTDNNVCRVQAEREKPLDVLVPSGIILGLCLSVPVDFILPTFVPMNTAMAWALYMVMGLGLLGMGFGMLLCALLPGTITTHKSFPKTFDRLLPHKLKLNLQARSRLSPFHSSITLSTEFAGLLPTEVRQQIKRQQANFDELLLVTEAHDWGYNTEKPLPIQGDESLLIGRKGDVFFLLNRFDTTPADLRMASADERP